MKPFRAPTLAFIFLAMSSTAAWSDPTFWVKGTPTPVPPAAPQVAPLEVEGGPASKEPSGPTTIEAPLIAEASPEPTPEPGRSLKSPLKAGVLSALIPGAGDIYAAQPVRGVLVAGVFGVALWQSIENFQKLPGEYKSKNATVAQLCGLAAIATYGFGVQDAYDSANRYNRRYHLRLGLGPRFAPSLQLACSF